MTANKLKRIVPPPGILDGIVWECLSIEGRFILCAIMMQAAVSGKPGFVRLEKKDWERWGLSWEQVYNTLKGLQTHEIIKLTEDDIVLIEILSWDKYLLH